MQPFHVENGTISVRVDNPDEAYRIGLLVDLVTDKPGANPAKPDAEGTIVRPIAEDMLAPGKLEMLLNGAGVEVVYGPLSK